MNVEEIVDEEKIERKNRISFRVFVTLIIMILVFAGYLAYEILAIIFKF